MENQKRWRSNHRQAEYNRLKKKTQEQEFVERLEREFEFSPRESRGVLEVVEEMFFENREIGAGQIEYTCVSSEEGPGKTMEELKKVRVKLTRELTSDREIQRRGGDRQMRKCNAPPKSRHKLMKKSRDIFKLPFLDFVV